MSRPPLFPDKTASGIAVDPRTLDRVVPESRRPDGTVRKELKIRPGFTPQEDVSRFRGSRQAQADRSALPKGHILGWVAPSSTSQPAKANPSPAPNKNAKKRARQRSAKKVTKEEEEVKDHWDDEDEDDQADEAAKSQAESGKSSNSTKNGSNATPVDAAKSSKPDAKSSTTDPDALADKVEKLAVN